MNSKQITSLGQIPAHEIAEDRKWNMSDAAIIAKAERTRTRAESTSAHAPRERHDGGCGARFSDTAACECGANRRRSHGMTRQARARVNRDLRSRRH